MNTLCLAMTLFAVLCVGDIAQANITIETVTVGDPGNAGNGTTGLGSVGYAYNIGKYEVTVGQYAAFLNAVAKTDTYGLYFKLAMSDTSTTRITQAVVADGYVYTAPNAVLNRPMFWLSYWNACRFANWLCNGQPTGAQDASTTERGMYNLDGYTGKDGRSIVRNAGAHWALTSEDEWYKAAYYKGGGTNAEYWRYATQSDTDPGRDMTDPFGNNANYKDPSGNNPIDPPYYTTVVGEFQNSGSYYGTFDQSGNVWEWTERIAYVTSTQCRREARGGGFYYDKVYNLLNDDPSQPGSMGIRLSYFENGWQPVPEPCSIMALAAGLAGLWATGRRRA